MVSPSFNACRLTRTPFTKVPFFPSPPSSTGKESRKYESKAIKKNCAAQGKYNSVAYKLIIPAYHFVRIPLPSGWEPSNRACLRETPSHCNCTSHVGSLLGKQLRITSCHHPQTIRPSNCCHLLKQREGTRHSFRRWHSLYEGFFDFQLVRPNLMAKSAHIIDTSRYAISMFFPVPRIRSGQIASLVYAVYPKKMGINRSSGDLSSDQTSAISWSKIGRFLVV